MSWFKRRNGGSRGRPRFGGEAARRPLWVSRLIKISLALSIVLVTVPLFPLARRAVTTHYAVGQVIDEEIIAPFSFNILKSDLDIERERAEAVRDVAPIFEVDEQRAETALSRLGRFRQDVRRLAASTHLRESERAEMMGRLGVSLLPASRLALANPDSAARILDEVATIITQAYEVGIVKDTDLAVLDGRLKVTLRKDGKETVQSSFQLMDRRRVIETVAERAAEIYPQSSGAAGAAMMDIARYFAEPNLNYMEGETARLHDLARQGVTVAKGRIEKGERIIDSHTKITENHYEILRSMEAAMAESAGPKGPRAWFLPLLGRTLLVAMLVVIFVAFLKRHRPQLYDDINVLVFLTTVGILVLLVAALVTRFAPDIPYLIPIGLAAILITLLLDDQLAGAAAIAVSILIGAVGGLGLSFVIVSIVGSLVASASVVGIRHRWQFYRSMLFTSAAYCLTILAVELITSASPFQEALRDSIWGVVNAVSATTVAIVLLPVLERYFGLSTDITLLELADLNRPIFRRMMLEANGTYHHTMVIGSLSEAAATAIDTNPLLARVGAYYHDIGKVAKAEYFGENLKPGMKNPHEKLSPTMSCLILESHVREGIEMARELKLPKVVRDFIPEHQGTTLMSYFYHKALEMDPGVDERDYRYPGPKPQSKETAIVMLADSVEATSRSLADPTPSRIKAVVKRIIDQRAADGQLDECNLTLQELARVRDAFVPVLVGLFHGRIQYQWQEKDKAAGEGSSRNPVGKEARR